MVSARRARSGWWTPLRGWVPRHTHLLLVWAARFFVVGALLLLWHSAMSHPGWGSLVSSPSGVYRQLTTWFQEESWWLEVWVTLKEALLGYLLGLVAALILVVLVVPIPIFRAFASPFIAAFNSAPKVIFAPLFIVWFGLGIESKVLFVASTIFFVVFYGVYSGLQTVDQTLLRNVRVLGASTLDRILHFYLPSILVWLIASFRLALNISLTSAVVAEYLGSFSGLGHIIAEAQAQLVPAPAVAGVLVIAIIATIFDRGLVRIETRLSRWRAF
jgi:NitT/TauT family transport system permease protein